MEGELEGGRVMHFKYSEDIYLSFSVVVQRQQSCRLRDGRRQ